MVTTIDPSKQVILNRINSLGELEKLQDAAYVFEQVFNRSYPAGTTPPQVEFLIHCLDDLSIAIDNFFEWIRE